ncbi:hypothetical protein R5R35_006440 [Gryllus longicercus]|uniref:Phosphomevalonate kinase n=1 Tax=Gryllus longicercus TaxID=2509291 RepID=A0AAN9ZD07_9ORTH
MCPDQTSNPKCILLFSGKRKSGKDFFTDLLIERIGHDNGVIVKLSAPIKSHWAQLRGLELSKLLDSSSYKEKYRQDMIIWGESMREKDYGYFCRHAIEMCRATDKSVWIVSDARRKTDIKWFHENYKNVKNIRIFTSDDVRKQRGWTFTEGIDDAPSECDLDDFTSWDFEIENNGNTGNLEESLNLILQLIKQEVPVIQGTN